MELWNLFLIKPNNELAKLHLTSIDDKQYVELIFKEKHLVFKIYDQETIEDFYTGISQEWIEFVLESSNSFLLDEGGIMDEFVFNLN